jgi:hypothetical protein
MKKIPNDKSHRFLEILFLGLGISLGLGIWDLGFGRP